MLRTAIALLPLIALGAPSDDFFESRVRPVLAANCFDCHTKAAMGGLRLDSREGMVKGGKSGAAIQPGKANESLLIQAVEQTHARLKMPPKGKLAADQVAALREWIQSGAAWPEASAAKAPAASKYWAFQPVVKSAPPATKRSASRAVDRFLLARIESEGIAPAPAADRRTLIRRVTFDLTGLPPTPEETTAFVSDRAANAYEKVVERLLASPRYGERWARHWLDLARYSDGQQAARDDTPYANAWRYRDWVAGAFQKDLPYDQFVKAQIAADTMPAETRDAMLPALGFQTIGESDDDRLDVTMRAFLGLTVGCARCHDHKYDPIPTRDYYSLLGVFKSSKAGEHPLVEKPVIDSYKKAKEAHDERAADLTRFLGQQTAHVVEILAARTSDYVVAAWSTIAGPKLTPEKAAEAGALDVESVKRWAKYLGLKDREHGFMDPWRDVVAKAGGLDKTAETDVRAAAQKIHASVQRVLAEKRLIDDANHVKVGGIEGLKNTAKVIKTLVDALPVDKYYFWREMASGPFTIEDIRFPGGVYHYAGKDLERFFSPQWKAHVTHMRAEIKKLKDSIPPAYPFVHVMSDSNPRDIKVAIRGDAANQGEVAPRRFLSCLSESEPARFKDGSGRRELAEAIASPANPLTARVMVNRMWAHHFGEGLVRSTSNFGRNGERPTHPELLDWLAARFVESGWSVKAMHREMVLSDAYQRASDELPAASKAKDPDNRLLWRANVRERLDAESLRDAILAVSGKLDPSAGGPSKDLSDSFTRRTIYATVSRSKPDRTLALFDFPDPNSASEQRLVTVGPGQRLFFMNSPFVAAQSKALAERLASEGATDDARIARAYELLYARPAAADEIKLGREYLLSGKDAWPKYAQVLLTASEFSAVK